MKNSIAIFHTKVFQKNKINKFDVLFSIIFLLGLYTGLIFHINENIFVPYILCGITSIYFFIRNFNDLSIYQLLPIFFIIIVTFCGVLCATGMSEFFLERMKGLIQLSYSLFISYIFYLNLIKWKPSNICNIFLIFIILILFGTFFENFTSFKEISDSFRHSYFNENIYEADLRDIYFYGIIRPKLFTLEPSHVAKYFSLCLFVWFSLSKNRLRYLYICIFVILGLFLIRSPIILIIIPISLTIEIFFRNKMKYYVNKKEKILIIEKSFAVLIILITIIGLLSVNTILEKRMNEIFSGYDDSFGVRFIGPVLIAVEVLKEYPVWGAGITGKEAISNIIDEVYYNLNVNYYNIYSFSTNIIFSFLIYYGFLGSMLFGSGVYILIKRMKISPIFFLITIFVIFGQTMGGFVGLGAWGYFFLIASVSSFYPRYGGKNNFRNNCLSDAKMQ